MKVQLAVVVASVALAACAGSTAREATDADAVRAQYERLGQAFADRDFTLVRSFFAADFESRRGNDPPMSRSQSMAALDREAARMLPPIRVDLHPDRIVVDRDTAQVHVSEDTRYHVRAADGSEHKLRYLQRYDDEWQRGLEGWQLRATVYPGLPYESFLDEKPASIAQIRQALGW